MSEIFCFLQLFSEFVLEKGRVRKKPRYKIKNMWEVLENAARKRRKCFIRYKKQRKRGGGVYEYYVAPYSFRNKPGGEVLFAYDLVDGHVKSFFRERVMGVHATDQKFRPKWDVEFNLEEDNVDTVLKSFMFLSEVACNLVQKEITPEEVSQFFANNPNPDDSKFHSWAEGRGYSPHEAETVAYTLATKFSQFLSAGMAHKKKISKKDVDPSELAMGVKVEREHTNDPAVAERIALDHLAEFRNYYTALADMEDKLRSKKRVKTEKSVMGSPPKAKEAAGSPKPKIVKPSASLRP